MSSKVLPIETFSIKESPIPSGVEVILFWSDNTHSLTRMNRSCGSFLKDSALPGSKDGYASVTVWGVIPELNDEP